MRFMIIVKATTDSEAGTMPPEELIAAMATYHEELAKAGVLLDVSGLQPSAKGWRIRYAGGKRSVIDGPFAETKELIAGYTLIQVRTREEAQEWTRRFPNPAIDGGQALQGAETATTVRWRNGRPSVTDGPFAETKEQLGGILILEARDGAEAVRLMEKHPGVRVGGFELRPADEAFMAQHPVLKSS